MAGRRSEFETAIIITGDAKGGIKAVRATDEELAKLNASQDKGTDKTKKYAKAHKDAGKDVGKFGDTVKKGAAMVATAALAAGAALAGIFKLSSASIAHADRTAQQLGVSTQSLMAQAEMARTAGLEFQDYADVIRDVSVRVQELAVVGTGEAADFFDKMNLDVQAFRDLAPDELIKRIGQEMEGLNRNERMLFLDQLGSDQGVALVDIIGKLDAMEQEAIAVGAALSDVDAAMVRNAAGDMAQIGILARGAGNEITVALSPVVSDLSDRLFQAGVEAGGIGDAVDLMIELMVNRVGFAADTFQQLRIVVKAIEAGWVGLGSVATMSLASQADAVAFLINGALGPFKKILAEIADGWGAVLYGLSRLGGPFADDFLAASDALSSFSRSASTFTVDAQGIIDLNAGMQAQLAESQGELDALLAAPPPSEGINQWFAEVKEKALAAAEAEVAARESQAALTETNDQATVAVRQLVEQMEFENAQIGKTSLEQKVATNLRKLDTSATDQQRAAVRRLTIERHEAEEAVKRQTEAEQEQAQFRENQIENTQKHVGELVYGVLDEGVLKWDNFWDSAVDGAKRAYAEMVALNFSKAIFSGGSWNPMDLLGFGQGGTGASGTAGVFTSGAMTLASSIPERFATFGTTGGWQAPSMMNDATRSASGAGSVGWKGAAMEAGAGIIGSYVGTQMGEEAFAKEANSALGATAGSMIGSIWGPLGAAFGGWVGGMVDAAFGSGSPSSNEGFLLENAPGVDPDRTFQTQAFASGLQPIGFNRRGDQADAEGVIEMFRLLDQAIVDLAEAADLSIVSSRATFQGLDETGRGSGLFFGAAHERNGVAGLGIDRQLEMFASDLIASLRGQIEDSDLDAILAAGGVDRMLAALSDLIEAEEEVAKAAEETAKKLDEQFTSALTSMQAAIEPVQQSIDSLARTIRSDILRLNDVAELRASTDVTITDEVRHLADLRQSYLENHAEQMRIEEALHGRRMDLARGLGDYMVSLQLGDLSILGARDQLALAQAEFRALAQAVRDPALAMEDRVAAGERLQGAGDSYLQIARRDLASTSAYRDIFREVMGVLEDASSTVGTTADFDPGAANQRLVSQLEMVNMQLAELPGKLASSLAPVISSFIMQGQLANVPDEYIANAIRSQGETAVAAANESHAGFVDANATSAQTIKDVVAFARSNFGSQKEALEFIAGKATKANISSDLLAQELGLTPAQMQKNLGILGIRGFAKGVSNFSGGLALVGEGGMELVDLPRGSSVHSNAQSMGMMRAADDKLITELRAMNRELGEIRRLVHDGNVYAGEQRSTANLDLAEIRQNLQSRDGMGGNKFAKRA